jgi:hypothetical protein
MDGHLRLRVRIEFAAVMEQVADYLWDGLYSVADGGWTTDLTLTAKQVDKAVRYSMSYRGSNYFVENDDEYEAEGGREWAQALVRKVYGFPEAT